MKLIHRTFKTVAAAALVATLAACGGGGDSTPTSTLKLSGVAATGQPISNGSVSVQCKSGSGSATTNANGSYTVTVTNGTGPCLVTVTGTTLDGSTVNLRSIASPDASGSAIANVNQLSDAVVVALAAAKGASTPTALVTSATAIPSQNDINAATTATINAVNAAIQTYNTANGTNLPILSSTANLLSDPNFVAKTSTTPGSAVDLVLDALKTANLVSNGTLSQTVQTNISSSTTQTVKPNPTGSA